MSSASPRSTALILAMTLTAALVCGTSEAGPDEFQSIEQALAPIRAQLAAKGIPMTREEYARRLAAAAASGSSARWDNDLAGLCIGLNGTAFLAYTGLSMAANPPFDIPFAYLAYVANLTLKYCAPVLNQPQDLAVDPNSDAGCSATFDQPGREADMGNTLGVPTPIGWRFNWGDLGTPGTYHINSTSRVSIVASSGEDLGNDLLKFPVGRNSVLWRAHTLVSLFDYAFIYVPKVPKDYETKRQIATWAIKAGIAGAQKWLLPPEPNGNVYNDDVQTVIVWDHDPPIVTVNQPQVTIEATSPGGAWRRDHMADLAATVSHSDRCGQPTTLTGSAPEFWPVDTDVTITWTASDPGPHPEGEPKTTSKTQLVKIRDTVPPVMLAPADLVIESNDDLTTVHLGSPQVFDLVDLTPAVTNDAPAQFPKGETFVTWTATDQSGNASHATQRVMIKTPGSNHAPLAHDQTGADAPAAKSFEPVVLTLSGEDIDADPLSFKLESQPGHGFFHSPLYPYFIEDYRVETHNTWDDLRAYCAEGTHQGHFDLPYPWQPSWVAVADDGTTYVIDDGWAQCDANKDLITYGRIAIFGPKGALQSMIYWDPAPQRVWVDPATRDVWVTDHDSGGVGWVDHLDPNLERLQHFRIDNADVPPGVNPILYPTDSILSTDGIFYVTDRNTIRAFLPVVGQYDAPQTLGSVLDSTSGGDIRSLAVDSKGSLYASFYETSQIYKFSPSKVDPDGTFHPGQLVGWMGRCDQEIKDAGDPNVYCDVANHRSIGFSCTDEHCERSQTWGTAPGQFNHPKGIAVDPNDVLYVTDYENSRVQRFTPEGYFAGEAHSLCDGSCFVIGDFGKPEDISVNSTHFYILDKETNLLHVSETSPFIDITDTTATLKYQSDNNFTGTDSFTFSVSDGLARSAPATVEVDVSRNQRPPVAADGLAASTPEDTPVPLQLDGSDPDGALDTLSYAVASAPTNGSLSGSGRNLTYTPAHNFVGEDEFSFTVSDGTFTSAPATVSLTVTPVNDPPDVTVDAIQGGVGFPVDLSGAFTDPDAGDLHLAEVHWGDGTSETEPMLPDDGSVVSGPLVVEGLDGNGSVHGRHVYTASGVGTVQLCLSDRVTSDSSGKHTTAQSLTSCATAQIDIRPMVDLLVTLDHVAGDAGNLRHDVFAVVNRMPQAGSGLTAGNVDFTDEVLPGAVVVSASSSAGGCSVAGSAVHCTLGSLAPGAQALVTVTLRHPIPPSSSLHTVSVTSSAPDVDPGSNVFIGPQREVRGGRHTGGRLGS